jgi:hypothetical protein
MLAISLDGLLWNFNQLALSFLYRGAPTDCSQQLYTGICERRCSDLWHSNHDKALQFPKSSCSLIYTIEWHHGAHCALVCANAVGIWHNSVIILLCHNSVIILLVLFSRQTFYGKQGLVDEDKNFNFQVEKCSDPIGIVSIENTFFFLGKHTIFERKLSLCIAEKIYECQCLTIKIQFIKLS